MSFSVSAQVVTDARALYTQGDYAGAWGVLAAAGDNYADNAQQIIAEHSNPQSLMARIVDMQWDLTVGETIKNQQFMNVAQVHLNTYLSLLENINNPTHTLPNTQQIETSYLGALNGQGITGLVAVDSIFAEIDRRIEGGYQGINYTGIQDISWGHMLDMESGRISPDSSVFQSTYQSSGADPANLLYNLLGGLIHKYGWDGLNNAGEAWDLIKDTLGEAAPQVVVRMEVIALHGLAEYANDPFNVLIIPNVLLEAFSTAFNIAGTAIIRYDPLVLDMNGDGVKLINLNDSNAHLDYNNDSLAERTGWVSPQDGLLAHDDNSNGHIDGLSELFGDATQTGFQELATYDTNHDGQITSAA